MLSCFLSEPTTLAVLMRSSRQMQSAEHSRGPQTLGIEARGVPGFMNASNLSTKHSQSGVHRPSGQGEREAAGVAAAFGRKESKGDERSSGGELSCGCLVGSISWAKAMLSSDLLPQPQSQSEKHVPSEHGLPLVHAEGLLPRGPLGFGTSGVVGGGTVPLLIGEVIVPLLQETPIGHAIFSPEARLWLLARYDTSNCLDLTLAEGQLETHPDYLRKGNMEAPNLEEALGLKICRWSCDGASSLRMAT